MGGGGQGRAVVEREGWGGKEACLDKEGSTLFEAPLLGHLADKGAWHVDMRRKGAESGEAHDAVARSEVSRHGAG